MRGKPLSGNAGAEVASGRAAFYEMLVSVFRRLPDRDLLVTIERSEFQDFLGRFSELGNGLVDSGIQLLASYRSSVGKRAAEEVLTELSVDRTRILRGTGHADLKPPYEGLYRPGKGMGDSVREIRDFYRRAGLLPDDANQEAADYLLVELDFLRQLCLREQGQWLSQGGLEETVAQEEGFLRDHLGRWAGDFCNAVERHALTDFYRGFSRILGGFLEMERGWLAQLSDRMKRWKPGRNTGDCIK